jgi:branched-chain amino acid aminotransferase
LLRFIDMAIRPVAQIDAAGEKSSLHPPHEPKPDALCSPTMPARRIWLDGSLVDREKAQTSLLSHAIQRGALVFDVGAICPGRGGLALLFRPREHIDRLLRSAALIGLDLRLDAAALLAATLETARASGVTSGLVRWSAFVPTLEADVVPHAGARVSVAIAVIVPEDFAASGESTASKPAASHVAIPRDLRKAGPEVLPPQAKVAAGYLGPMLAKRRALAEGFDEVVLLDGEGRVAEAPTANIFAVRDGALITPPLERVLAGVTRDAVLAIARAEGISAREEHSVNWRPLHEGAPGRVTTRIMRALVACQRGEDARFEAWTLPLR